MARYFKKIIPSGSVKKLHALSKLKLPRMENDPPRDPADITTQSLNFIEVFGIPLSGISPPDSRRVCAGSSRFPE